MRLHSKLSTIADAIGGAVIGENYEQAEALLSIYCRQLQTELQRQSWDGDRLAAEKLHTEQLLDWVLRMTRTGRAHDAARLAQRPACPRSRHAEEGLHSWELTG